MGGGSARGGRRAPRLAFVVAATLTGGCNSVFGIHEGTPPPPCYDPGPTPLLIDDMEDGVGDICNLGGRQGYWYTVGDGTEGTLSPAQGATFTPTMISGGRGSSHHAARFTGSDFTGWGALMGFNLDTVGLMNQTVNASATGGITFWMKNDVPVSVDFLIPDTVLQTDGGDCVPSASNPNCSSHFSFQITAPSNAWTQFQVPFAALTQQFGGTATWNPQLLLGIQFAVASGAAFDVWVDDISFYYCSTGACLPTCADPEFTLSCPAGNTYPAACRLPGTDCSAAPGWCSDPMLLDDMEDGNALICNSGGRQGSWYTAIEGTTGTLSPAPGATFIMTPIVGGRGDSHVAAHMTASGFTDGAAEMGFSLSGAGTMSGPYDASAPDGLTFWMKTDAPNVELVVPTAETVPVSEGGLCSDNSTQFNCGNHFSFFITPPNPNDWIEYKVPYGALYQEIPTQDANGNFIVGTATWDPKTLEGVVFGVGSTASFELWIDDIGFYNDCSADACLPTCTDPTAPVACPALGTVPAGCWPSGTDCSKATHPLWNYRLLSLWGSESTDVWAVGFDLRDASAATLHWDGAAWSSFPPAGAHALWGVWGSSSGDVWAVGDFGTIVHWNGTAWSGAEGGVSLPLRSVWGSGPGDVWAAGANGTIVHWDGTAWSPFASSTTQTLFSLWGSGPNDVWTVGDEGTVLHGDGTAWTLVPSSTTADLASVWGSGPNDVWAVGSGGTIVHWDGSMWKPVASGTTAQLTDVWASRPNDAWAVSFDVVLHWNGSSWTAVSGGNTEYLSGVWGSGPTDVWTGSFLGPTLLRHYDGSTWSPVTLAPATQ